MSSNILDDSKLAKVRIYVPLVDHKISSAYERYTYFYLLKIDSQVTGDEVLAQVLNQMQLPFNLVARSASDLRQVVDPTQYCIVIKLGPPVLNPNDDRALKDLIKSQLAPPQQIGMQQQEAVMQESSSIDLERILSAETMTAQENNSL